MLRQVLIIIGITTSLTNPPFASKANEFEQLIFQDDCDALKRDITLTYLSFLDAQTQLADKDQLLSLSTVEMQIERYLDEASKLANIYGVICKEPLMRCPLTEEEGTETLQQKLIKDGLISGGEGVVGSNAAAPTIFYKTN